MKTNRSLDWIGNLYEVSSPIRDAAAEIARSEAEAAEVYKVSMARARHARRALLARVARLWTPEEIADAKRYQTDPENYQPARDSR